MAMANLELDRLPEAALKIALTGAEPLDGESQKDGAAESLVSPPRDSVFTTHP
jgi:hypothetical protein